MKLVYKNWRMPRASNQESRPGTLHIMESYLRLYEDYIYKATQELLRFFRRKKNGEGFALLHNTAYYID